MPQVSIIIPLYNKAPYVRKTLDSVLAQTYTSYECIIVDDSSTDDSVRVVEQWLSDNQSRCCSRFRLFSKDNAGVSAARNFGVSQSSGEWIAFLDADDWWEPTFLAEMVAFAEQTPKAGLWACNYIYYKPGKTRISVTNLAYVHGSENGFINYPKSYAQGTGMPITSISMLMPRTIFDALGGFPIGISLGEDFLFWSKIAQHYPVAFLDKPLAYYNNAIPASLRATRNLHDPACHMLWHLEGLTPVPSPEGEGEDWRLLLSKLRAEGLLEYWLDSRYHDVAAAELAKVDWTLLPPSAHKPYLLPVWLVRARRAILRVGSACKQFVLKCLNFLK